MGATARFVIAAAALAAVACTDPSGPASAPEPAAAPQPSAARSAAATGEAIPGRYIVVLNADAADVPAIARRLAAAHGGRVSHVFQTALRGFAAELPDAAVAALAANPAVAYVEQDQVMRASTTQLGATWGLDRIDQRVLPLGGSFTYVRTGAAARAYIIDTGIRLTHAEFGGRAVSGRDAVDGGSADDCNGHGTHVAATVGGRTYGVAKGVRLVAVRVLDCLGFGSTSGVIAGVDWVAANRVLPAVANMSLGGGASTALDAAVQNAIAKGVTFAIAAGNGNLLGWAQDACRTSPARVVAAITVGATDRSDRKASWSNYGTCLDLFAPGVGITSAWHSNDAATNTISGTSMAAPHVAGVAALYLDGRATATPQQVRDALVTAATAGVVLGAGAGSPNRLLFSAY